MKKLLLVGLIGAGLFFVLGKKKEEEELPAGNDAFRELTDAEALNYLKQNGDLSAVYGETGIEKAKWHWQNFGVNENRASPYLS